MYQTLFRKGGVPVIVRRHGLSTDAGQAFVPPSTVRLAPVM